LTLSFSHERTKPEQSGKPIVMHTHHVPLRGAAGGGLPAAVPSPVVQRQPEEQLQAKALLQRLQDHIARIEQTRHQLTPRHGITDRTTKPRRPWHFGLEAVDAHLPEQGLARHGLHDLAPARYGDTPATLGFALSLALQRFNVDHRMRPILWCRSAIECQEHGKLYGHGAENLGLPREKLLVLVLKKQVSLFWTMEEALKSGCFSSIISDAASQHTDLTITRRLSLSAGEGRSAGLLVFNRNHNTATASTSRWQVAATPSLPPLLEPQAPGYPAWAVTLSRIRGGRPGHWTLLWHPQHHSKPSPSHHASHHFSLVPGFPGRALSAGTAQAELAHAAQEPALRTG
jgi:protein ImuA